MNDHSYTIPVERFAGKVPAWLVALQMSTLGVTPIGFHRDGSPIWPMAGGSLMTLADLDAFRTLEEYVTYQGNLDARMKEIDAEYAGKPLPEDVASEFADLQDIRKETVARTTELRERRQYLDGLGQDDRHGEPAFRPPTTKPQHARRVPEDVFALEQYRNLSTSEPELLQAYRDGAMFAVEQATYPHPESKAAVEQEHIAKLLDTVDKPSAHNPNRELARRILVTGSPTYERAFTKYIQGRPLSPDEQRAVAPLTVQTDATGGFAVPFYFDPTLLHVGAWTNMNPYRAAGTVKTIVGTDTFHGATAAAATATRAAEAAAVTEGGMAIGQISAIVGKVHSMVTLSMELLQDRPDIASELASLIAEAKDTEEESSFSIGVGDALGAGFNPIGLFAAQSTSGAYTEIETIGNNALAIGDAYALEAAVPIRHRANAAWFLNRAEIRAFQALETAGGQLFGGQNYASVGYPANSPVGNTGLRMLQYPIWEVPSAPSGTTSNFVVAVLASGKSFYIIERAGMSVEVIPVVIDQATGYPTGQRGIYAWWRNTAKPADVNAGRRLTVNAP